MGKVSYIVNAIWCDGETCSNSFEQNDLEPMKKLVRLARAAGWQIRPKKRGGKCICPKCLKEQSLKQESKTNDGTSTTTTSK